MARKEKMVRALAYLRTSSASNVGPDKDSDKRQRAAITAFAKRAGYEVVGEFYDSAVSGSDALEARPGFAALLDRIEDNHVRVVLVEDASRFARDLMTQELGILSLIKRGMSVVTASGDDLTNTDDPMKVAMRQIAGAFAQLEKSRLVGKLREARERKRAEGHKVEGRPTLAESHPQAVAMARELRRRQPRISLRKISAELAKADHLAPSGQPYAASSIRQMIRD
jgi:DNA invertase Pin-like site-specific DNA recombinase